MSSASERETLVMDVVNRVRLQPCTCPLRHCPFNLDCTLCVRNHRLDGTLTHCMLPPEPERDNCGRCRGLYCEYYPDCRSPVLWLVHFARRPWELRKWLGRLRNPRLRRLVEYLAEVFDSPAFREAWSKLDRVEEEEREARQRLREYAEEARKHLQRARRNT